ncbi:MAG: hypothetical protein OEY33_08020 [Bdellovibrionales bacterium]|jgi:uncharacterized membrane protein (DUF2068 family)|nr:hypothetical protein [Bdellovibrionales bacterium]
MKDIPRTLLLVIILLLTKIFIDALGAYLNHEKLIKLLMAKNLKLPMDPTSFTIFVHSFNGLVKSLFALGLYLRLNWVRVFLLIVTIISLPFSLFGIVLTDFSYDSFQRIFSILLSLLIIYSLIKNKAWFKKNE